MSSLSMKLPAYTNEQFGNDVSYFPSVCCGSEDSNLLITCFMYQLKLHQERTCIWPHQIYLALDSKGTNKSYDFVSALVELVQLRSHLGIEDAWCLFGEPGHHIMKIEHMHSRTQTWFNEQKRVDSLSAFQSMLDNKCVNAAHFIVRPISWIYDFSRRYEGCVSDATRTIARIKSKRLVHITRDAVVLYTEPMQDLKYPDEFNLCDITNPPIRIEAWFSREPREHPNPWAAPVIPRRTQLQALYKHAPDCPGLLSMIKLLMRDKRTSMTAELQPFWSASGTPRALHAQSSVSSTTSSSSSSSLTIPSTYTAASRLSLSQAEQPVTLPPVSAAHDRTLRSSTTVDVGTTDTTTPDDSNPFPRLRDSSQPPRRRFVLIVCDSEGNDYIFTCFVYKVSEDGRVADLVTMNVGFEGEQWQAELDPLLEGNLDHEEGWKYITSQEALKLRDRDPVPRTPDAVQSLCTTPPLKRRKIG